MLPRASLGETPRRWQSMLSSGGDGDSPFRTARAARPLSPPPPAGTWPCPPRTSDASRCTALQQPGGIHTEASCTALQHAPGAQEAVAQRCGSPGWLIQSGEGRAGGRVGRMRGVLASARGKATSGMRRGRCTQSRPHVDIVDCASITPTETKTLKSLLLDPHSARCWGKG
jgi:hypothetical protein